MLSGSGRPISRSIATCGAAIMLYIISLLSSSVGLAQTLVNLKTQSRNIDFSRSTTKTFQVGTVLPSTCEVGQVFFKTNAPSGENWFGCIGVNMWSLQSSRTHLPDVGFSGNKAMVCNTCGANIATARFLNTTRQYSGPVEMTITGGVNTATVVRFYIDPSLNLRAQYDGSVITAATFGAGLLPDTAGTQFPAASLPLYTCSVSSLTFTECTDVRATGSWIPSSSTGSCAITATANGWNFDCPGLGGDGVLEVAREMQAATCDWSGIARPRDISVKAAADPGSSCFNGIGALSLPNSSAGMELLFGTLVPYGILGSTDVYVDLFSPSDGAVTLTLAVACRAPNTVNSNYQTNLLTYGNAESQTVPVIATQTHRFTWTAKGLPACNPGEELHWQLMRDGSDANPGVAQVLRAVVVQRVN